MKRRLYFLAIILAIILTACGGDDLPTRAPVETVPETLTPDESPRIGPDSELPPTWTPAPTLPVATPQLAGEEGSTTSTGEQETYTVQPGDTLAEIAAAFGVTLDDLVEANDIENIDVIEVDDVLIIPR